MNLDKDHREEIIRKYRLHEKDTKSTDLQIALLTERIRLLNDELDTVPDDRRLRLILLRLVAKRRRLIGYLNLTNSARCKNLMARLGLQL